MTNWFFFFLRWALYWTLASKFPRWGCSFIHLFTSVHRVYILCNIRYSYLLFCGQGLLFTAAYYLLYVYIPIILAASFFFSACFLYCLAFKSTDMILKLLIKIGNQIGCFYSFNHSTAGTGHPNIWRH